MGTKKSKPAKKGTLPVVDKAAGYGHTDRSEDRSVKRLEWLLEDDRLKLFFNRNSTIPNTDGSLQVLEEGETWNPIANFDVQIKTIDERDLSRRGYNVSRELLAYAKDVAANPVLLFGVKADKEIALWVHLDKALAQSLLEQSTSASTTVKFPEGNTISKSSDKSHIEKWIQIHSKAVKAIQLFDELEVELQRARAASAIVSRTGTAISLPGDGRKLQEFSDKLNDLYNREFSFVKNLFYQGVWKIGLGIFECGDRSLSYTLFPIPVGSTDLQIKKLDQKAALELREIEFLHSHFRDNPIYLSPEGYAFECVSESVKRALELNTYNFSDDLLCREIVFGTVENDRYGILGLDRGSSSLRVKDLEHALNTYLPCYVHVFLSGLMSAAPNLLDIVNLQLQTRGFVEVDDLLALNGFLPASMREQMRDEVARALKDESQRVRFPLHSKILDLRRFKAAISKLSGVVARPYESPQDTGRGGWIWRDYTIDDVHKKLTSVVQALPACIADVAEQTFPLLVKELDFFRDFDLLIVQVRDSNRSHSRFYVEFHCVKSDDPTLSKQVVVLSPDDRGSFQESDEEEWVGTYLGKRVRIVCSSSGSHEELYKAYPLATNVRRFLHERLEQYFRKNGSGRSWGPRNQYV